MKSICTIFIVTCLSLISVTAAFAQVTGDYQTNGTGGGDWNVNATWLKYNGASWVAATAPPTGSETITLLSTDSVSVNVPVTITGTLVCKGGKVGNSAATLTFGSTGVYLHDADAGKVPAATWSTGSTCKLTGLTAAGPSIPSDMPLYNLDVELHKMTYHLQLNMTGTSVTINGNLRIGATVDTNGSVWQLRLSGSSATYPSKYRTYYIAGNLIMDSARSLLTFCGSSTANTGDSVYVGGDVIINGGEFSINRGSQASAWLFCSGNFTIAEGAKINRHSTSNYPCKIYFRKSGKQTFTNAGTITTGYTKTIEMFVDSGSIFNTGTSHVTGGVNFTLKSGATLETAKDGGVDSAIASNNGDGTAVVKTFEIGSNFIFDGSVPQVTGSIMPTELHNLDINNSSGVTLTQTTTIDGLLRLRAGVFDNTIPFTLGPGASISYEGGSLLNPVSVEPEKGAAVPQSFFVDQNYPNPFNPATTLRFGLPGKSSVSVKLFNLIGQEVATLFEGYLDAGVHTLHFDAAKISSGVYFYRIQAGKAVEVKRMTLIK